ncbi:autophagy-related protein 17 [Podospora conica]|nr:autophagy-related protein 17 [Schizothecium conicum]
MSSRSASSSDQRSYHEANPHVDRGGHVDADADASAKFDANQVPVEVLVNHLLHAKQSLSSINLVLRAHELVTNARQMHEDSVVLGAQTDFLRRGIQEQTRILLLVHKMMTRAYDHGRRDFKKLIAELDRANAQLEETMAALRSTRVDPSFRPPGEEPKCLMDFVDENQVEGMHDALKESIKELRAAQESFDRDLLRFETDIRNLKKTMSTAIPPSSTDSSASCQPIPDLLASLSEHSHAMAEQLTSLTQHFDLCVKAVRATEGGAALARRQAADLTEGGEPVSVSGVIAEQDAHNMADLEAMDPQERAEVVQVVVDDAHEVDEVVSEIQAGLLQMEADFGALKEQTDRIRAANAATIAAFHFVDEIGAKLQSYIDAEAEFVQRWEDEKEIVYNKVDEMSLLREFYDGYASAYGSLMLEVERRRAVQEKIANTWRKAKETVDKLVEGDRKEREHFRQEIGEFLPTDLWVGMVEPATRWEVVAVEEEAEGSMGTEASTPTLKKAKPVAPGRIR